MILSGVLGTGLPGLGTEHLLAGWNHRLNGHEFERTPGVGTVSQHTLHSNGSDYFYLIYSSFLLCPFPQVLGPIDVEAKIEE